MDKINNDLKSFLNLNMDSNQVTENDLFKEGLVNVIPRDYQLFGVNWLLSCCAQRSKHGVILGDEMGLGKTLQTICFLLHTKNKFLKGPYLVMAPLSVIDEWKKEFSRFAPSISVLKYIGNKEQREEIRKTIASNYSSSNCKNATPPFDVLLTSYELCMKDECFMCKFRWNTLVVDEAHRLKNSESLLYQVLLKFDINFKILLTGTPVQNNLKELFALLSFVSSDIFKLDYSDEFVQYFSSVADESSSSNKTKELHGLLKPFLLRRTKNEVVSDLPEKSEVVINCGMSALQKKLYKAVLTKDLDAFAQDHGYKTRLMNILMQLRKCCNHPYIFPGTEPEPFQLGEHLIDTSGKLFLLDRLLKTLKQSGHKVLLFSQMTTMLDIVQDYLGYRGYTYERLDGSVRGEERFLAVNNFNSTAATFLFLLSTRAGGQGLNLMTADTVIFLDSDFNPQNDLQAAARAHRIGQTRPVKIIRLVAKNTVDEIILHRAKNKLLLTNTVIEGGQFSNIGVKADELQLSDILKFGLEDLLKTDDGSFEEIDFEKVLGKSRNGEWVVNDPEIAKKKLEGNKDNEKTPESMYVYEGEDYSKICASDDDKSIFDELAKVVSTPLQSERALRKDPKQSVTLYLPDHGKRKRRVLTEEEKQQLRLKREESKAKRIKLQEEQRLDKIKKLWQSHNYTSCKVDLSDDDDDDDNDESVSSFEDGEEEEDYGQLYYVVGDVTRPQQLGLKDAIVVHCVDDSGYWGSGGLFTAINNRSKIPGEQYELAAKVKDLSLGDVHLVKMVDDQPCVYVALVVAHTRNKRNHLSPLLMNHLNEALEKIYHVAKETRASVHFPRIGYNTPNFNWYGTEKLIKKSLAQRKIRTFVYYFKRHKSTVLQTPSSATNEATTSKQGNDDDAMKANESASLPDMFLNYQVCFHGLDDPVEQKRLSRYVIAYDGDIDRYLTSDTTHIVCTLDSRKTLANVDSKIKLVTKDWIDDCVKSGYIVDEEKYFVT